MPSKSKLRSSAYYLIKPFLPRSLQLRLRRKWCRSRLSIHSDTWPIDASACKKPSGWQGWPDGRRFALVLTHDVESAAGQRKCLELAALEQKYGFRSSFNFVARSYKDSPDLRRELIEKGFEIGIHGLYHNGLMYASETIFRMHSKIINRYLMKWGCVGFRSPAMHHNLDWTHYLNILYDSSTFDTDPFEPQPNAVRSIFPVWVQNDQRHPGHVELPYTLPQDFTLFVMLQEKSIDIWKRKLDWIADHGGMALILTHPDYMTWGDNASAANEYPADYYAQFLQYIRDKYQDSFWHALPKDVAAWWPNANGSRSIGIKPNQGERARRVCMLSYSFYETDNRVKRYAESLIARGDQVDAICLKRPGQPSMEYIRGVRVFRIQQRTKNERGMASYLVKLIAFFIRSGLCLSRQHMKSRYDLVHVHNIPDFEVFAAIIPKLMGAGVVLDIHDIVPELFVDKFHARKGGLIFKALAGIERMSTAFANHVIISNDLWYKSIVSRSAPAEKCSVFLNYPDRSTFDARKYPKQTNSRRTFLYPGSLNQHQGLDIAIRAFSLIKDQAPDADLQIYGEGPARQALTDLIEHLGIGERVIIRDALPVDQIAAVMASAYCGIVPKRAAGFGNEAFSTKILEFMALEIPVIVSETRIDRHYFDDTLVMFFRPEDERDLADKMLLILQRGDIRDSLIDNSLRYIAERNWEIKKGAYLELIDRLSNTHR